ncbi:MAG: glycosyltransferase family 2 protein [Actinomycetota bacterium]|nr:glycosyltransferase family 2 protein [Actinomycetota bacterium]
MPKEAGKPADMQRDMKLPLTAVIMTFNEKRNLRGCLESVRAWVDEIVIVDSFSTDETIAIAKEYAAKIYQHEFINHAKQFAWAMRHTDIRNEWVLRIDADERWTPDAFWKAADIIANDRADGINVKMKIYFMGRWIRHGGFYPNYFLRVFKKSKGTIEDRWMDEHIRVDGRVASPDIDVIEANYDRQKNLALWTDKHNTYSTREAVESLIRKHRLSQIDTIGNLSGGKTQRKRWMKENVYLKTPLFVRPFLYFIYRYVFRLGFLDGKEGFVFHTLHAFWYRFLVDAKAYQIEKNARDENVDVRTAIKNHYGMDV